MSAYLRANTVFVLLSLAVVVSSAAEANTFEQAIDIEMCRDAFPAVASNPGAMGGWRVLDGFGSRSILCIYGDQPNSGGHWDAWDQSLASLSITVIVRSRGGIVDPWLEIAERLAEYDVRLLVDEACFSSCAIFMPVIADDIQVGANSLIVWHGGPTGMLSGVANAGSFGWDINGLLNYLEISRRTEDLYARAGVSLSILTDSADQTSPVYLTTTMQDAGLNAYLTTAIAGYAYSLGTLQACFGFNNISAYWHPGNDQAVAAFSQQRSPNLLVLESPKNVTGQPRCLQYLPN